MKTPFLEQLISEIQDLKNNQITSTASGTEITITDSANAKIRDLKIYGDIQQDGTPTIDNPVEIKTVTGDVTISIDSKNYLLSLGDIELCGNSNYGKDYIYKKGEKWYKHCVWSKSVLDSTTIFSLVGSAENYYEFVMYNFKGASFVSNTSNAISTHFSNITNNRFICAYKSTMYIRVPAEYEIDTADKFNQFISENNVTFYYLRGTESDEEITDTTLINQLDRLYNARMNKTETNITVSSDNLLPTAEVEYVVDLEAKLNDLTN